jgi:hypothetical protein
MTDPVQWSQSPSKSCCKNTNLDSAYTQPGTRSSRGPFEYLKWKLTQSITDLHTNYVPDYVVYGIVKADLW